MAKRKLIAIIPARAGSKRLPGKNLKPLFGKPLICWTIEEALKAENISQVIVSTECPDIARIAEEAGAEVPFLRPESLAGDKSSTMDVLNHTIAQLEARGEVFTDVALLQPTSPLRGANHIDAAWRMMQERSARGVVAVTEVDHSPLWCNTLPENLSMVGFLDKEAAGQRSQDLPSYFRINGAIYIFAKGDQLDRGFYSDADVYAYKMDKLASIDIDDIYDFKFAETLLKASGLP